MTFPRLIADIGGTNARFGLQREPDGPVLDVQVLQCADHATPLHAVQTYLRHTGGETPRQAAFGIATPITGDHVAMTNNPWSFSIEAMKQALSLDRLLVINDFTALALALPALSPAELRPLGGGTPKPNATRALIGPGTGLGVGGLLIGPNGEEVPISGEGGHVTLAATNEDEAALIARLRRHWDHVSAERVVSGPGLVTLYEARCALDGTTPAGFNAAEISQHALDATDALCTRTVQHFLAFLGNAAGNLALTLGALGGVYLGGGILPRLWPLLETSALRSRFEQKGRFQSYLEHIPIYVIDAANPPALTGAARALRNTDA